MYYGDYKDNKMDKYTLDRIAIQIDNAIIKIKNGEIKWNYQKQKVKLPLTKN